MFRYFNTLFKISGVICGCFLASATLAQNSRTIQIRTGQDVMLAHLEITGGTEYWETIEAVRWEADMTTLLDTLQVFGKRTTISQFPYYRYTEQNVMNGQVEQRWRVVYTPEQAWMETPTQQEDIPQDLNPSFERVKDELAILANPIYQVLPLEKGVWEYKQVYIVTIRHQDKIYRRYYNRATLMLIRVETTLPNAQTYITSYSDYRAVGSVLFPYHIEVQPPNAPRQVFNLTNMELNPKIDEKLFVRN